MMDALNARLDEGGLDATAGQKNPASASNALVLTKPQPFDGTRWASAEAFVGQIGLHAITYPKHFPINASKVVFAVLFVFNGKPVNHDEVALQNLHQTGTVLAYTQNFNQQTRTMGWANTPLMSLYQHSLKEKIQPTQLAMSLKADQEIEGIWKGNPIPSTSTKGPKQTSDAKHTCWVQLNLCFCCGQAGHISHRCLNGGQKPQGRLQPSSSTQLSKLLVDSRLGLLSYAIPTFHTVSVFEGVYQTQRNKLPPVTQSYHPKIPTRTEDMDFYPPEVEQKMQDRQRRRPPDTQPSNFSTNWIDCFYL
ncbi:uncharacterized protein VP01_311g5 [Puccinia sorghi]|uniref:CCHC-type domain-containing protein n=1 Tax=Puccinia sorghi TaxID=27349 RepID=A0A0L6V147_9BASI|nr:uncharacterized protein VP01_311g5 [Puccinia sorghi]